MFDGRVLQKRYHMDTNSASLLTDLFLYLCEVEFIQRLLMKTKKPSPILQVPQYKRYHFIRELGIKDIKDTARHATKEMISIFQLRTFHLYLATSLQHLHMEYITTTKDAHIFYD